MKSLFLILIAFIFLKSLRDRSAEPQNPTSPLQEIYSKVDSVDHQIASEQFFLKYRMEKEIHDIEREMNNYRNNEDLKSKRKLSKLEAKRDLLLKEMDRFHAETSLTWIKNKRRLEELL